MDNPASQPSASAAPGSRVALIVFDQASALGAVAHAERLAAGQTLQLILIANEEDERPSIPEWATGIARSTTGAWDPHVEIAASPVEAVTRLCAARDSPIAFVAVSSGSPQLQALRRLVASPPCNLAVLFNADIARECRRVLIATNTFAPLSKAATEMSYRLIPQDADVHVDFLRLVSNGEQDHRESLRAALEERIAARAPGFTYDVLVEPARSFEGGLLHHAGFYALRLLWHPAPWSLALLAGIWSTRGRWLSAWKSLPASQQRALVFALGFVFTTVAMLTPASRFAERYIFSANYALAAVGIVVALRLWPALRSTLTRWDQQLPALPALCWTLLMVLRLIVGPLLPRISS